MTAKNSKREEDMTFFSADDKARIAEAIRKAEENTSGEIVTVVARESDSYRFIALLWAALIALAVPLVLIYAPWLTNWYFSFQGPQMLYLIQLATFLALSLLFQLSPLRHALTPGVVKRARAHRNAVEQFIAQDLHTTSARTGVLIFVSIAERYVEVLADDQIARKVDADVWRQAVEKLTSHIGAGRSVEGFEAAISLCGKVLSQHFPPGEPSANELPNHLIELN